MTNENGKPRLEAIDGGASAPDAEAEVARLRQEEHERAVRAAWSDEHGHGHLKPREDGIAVPCGGPGVCLTCRSGYDAMRAEKPDMPEAPQITISVRVPAQVIGEDPAIAVPMVATDAAHVAANMALRLTGKRVVPPWVVLAQHVDRVLGAWAAQQAGGASSGAFECKTPLDWAIAEMGAFHRPENFSVTAATGPELRA